jgi:Flp pilus assembly protein TadD
VSQAVANIAAPKGTMQLAAQAPTVPVPLAEIFAVAAEYVEAGRLDAGERLLGHVLASFPAQPDAVHLKGLIAFRRGRLADAVGLMERSNAIGGGHKSVHWRNLAEAYRLLGRLDDALTAARRAITLDPADSLGPFTLAMVHYDRLEVDECVASARHALVLKPNLPQAHMKLAQAFLLKGDFAEGLEHYEHRYKIPGAAPLMPRIERPQWDGRALPSETLLLIGDQGYGDVIMFGRYLSWVLERCPNVVMACSAEMVGLVKQFSDRVRLVVRWDEVPPHACYCPLSGLPRLAGTRLETIPAEVPYLRAEPERAARWRARLDRDLPAGLKRVGIAWAGRPTHNNDHNRTIRLDMLAPLGEVPGIGLVSLQKGPAAAQAKAWKGTAPLLHLDAEIGTFDDTAAIIDGLDLVLCVDTSLVHMAGAMNRALWAMLPYAPDWRWLMRRSDTQWYPSVRLFRQGGPKQWAPLIQHVVEQLAGHFASAA